jgi:hypothetical protein
METATQQTIRLDIKRNRAQQNAQMLVRELVQGGYLADRCQRDAISHLADVFYRLDVEITTAEQRALKR